jgi:hypothetical protein
MPPAANRDAARFAISSFWWLALPPNFGALLGVAGMSVPSGVS